MNKKSIVGVVQDLENKKKSMESQLEHISETLDLLKNTIEYEYSNDYKHSKNGIAGNENNNTPPDNVFLGQNMIETLEEILKKNTKKYSNKNVIL